MKLNSEKGGEMKRSGTAQGRRMWFKDQKKEHACDYSHAFYVEKVR
jgi:hypothetical protein